MIISCNKPQETVETESQSDLIEITQQQFDLDKMELGKIEQNEFFDIVKCNAIIVSQTNGIANLSIPISGIVNNIRTNVGQLVSQGQVLIDLTGNELIDLQKDFGETSAILDRLTIEYERTKSLYIEKVATEKDYILAQSEYNSTKAKYNGLKMKLDALGLSANNIKEGNYYKNFQLKSPISGYVTNIKTTIGSFVEPQNTLIEIINPKKIQVKLSVFQDDIQKIRIGQKVNIKSNSAENEYVATIKSIGKTIDDNTKSIECYAELEDVNISNPITNVVLGADIIINKYNSDALPSDAVFQTDDINYILVLDHKDKDIYYFKKEEIKIGTKTKDYIEIKNSISKENIITKNIYNIAH